MPNPLEDNAGSFVLRLGFDYYSIYIVAYHFLLCSIFFLEQNWDSYFFFVSANYSLFARLPNKLFA